MTKSDTIYTKGLDNVSHYFWLDTATICYVILFHMLRSVLIWKLDNLWTAMYFPDDIVRDASRLAYVCWHLSLQSQISTRTIGTHKHKHTCMISTWREWREPGTGVWLRGVEEGFLLKKRPSTHTHTHTHTHKTNWQHTEMSNIKRFEQIELPTKLLDYFSVWSNKSNINQKTHAIENAYK